MLSLEAYKILLGPTQGELTEKKSRFLAAAEPVKTEEEALLLVEREKKRYWDARHHCFAYLLGDRNQIQRCSDDGEPSQTAGRPMLDVLLGADLRDVCVVVTRYFGGTLLGTGGLVRAYSGAVQEALKNGRVAEKHSGRRLGIRMDYTGVGKIQYVLGQRRITVLDTEYTDQVRIWAMAPSEELAALTSEITEGTSGRAVLEEGPEVFYAVENGQICLLDERDRPV